MLLSLLKVLYKGIIHDISRSEALNTLKNSELVDRGYIWILTFGLA